MTADPSVSDLLRQPALWSAILRRVARLSNRGDAEDLVHSAFLKLQQSGADVRARDPAALLVRTAVNLGIDHHRRERRNVGGKDDDVAKLSDYSPLPDEALIARERLAAVRQAMLELPPRTRDILLMHRVDGLKYREIASRLNISQSAVEKHIAKGSLFLAQRDFEP